ncbi:MAG: hypothetical protein D6790_04385 [Caldilineae bacterium]|nr:MAG: hypothetical protein D6790_04385 [Caldilineae bacterium]
MKNKTVASLATALGVGAVLLVLLAWALTTAAAAPGQPPTDLRLAPGDEKSAYDSEWEDCADRCSVGSMEIHPPLPIRGNPPNPRPPRSILFSSQTTEVCDSITAAPQEECQALVSLYASTDGPHWITNTGWLSNTTGNAPCDWYGVTCVDSHITELRLSANRLTGAMPRAIAGLSRLSILLLDNNRLEGPVPRAVCNLTTSITRADFGYNLLYSRSRQIRQCLRALDPDWQATQTLPPQNLTVSAITSRTILLTWTPISYTADGGYYEVGLSTTGLANSYQEHGRTPDKLAASYLVTGLLPGRTYYLRVRTVTPAHDSQPDDLTSRAASAVAVTEAPNKDILLAVYFPADNNLAPYLSDVVRRLRKGTALNPNVQVVFLGDGRQANDTQVLTISHGTVHTTTAVTDRWGGQELDTSDPAVLAWFLDYARTNYPRERTIASLMGHGVGLSLGFEAAPGQGTRKKVPPLPQGHDFTPGDVTDNSYMSTVELGQALLDATQGGAQPFDLIFFDQCFQGNFDVLYQVRKAAQGFIASPNYAWLVAPYGQYITQLAPARTTQEIAQAILYSYEFSLNNEHPNAIFSVASPDLDDIQAALSQLGDALTAALQAGQASPILAATEASQFADTTQCRDQRLILGPPDELIGAGSFARALQDRFASGDAYGVHSAAGALLTALDKVQGLARTGAPWVNPDATWAFTDTLTILAPLAQDTPSTTAWRASIYTETANLQAVWALSPTAQVIISTPLASAVDGRWDDFLHAWYTDLTPTVGQWCQYTPPPLNLTEDAEPILLQAAAHGPQGVGLTWLPSDNEAGVEQQILRRGPKDVQWSLYEVVDVDASSFEDSDLAAGVHLYMVTANTDAGEAVAVSNPVTWTVASERVFLPVINR